MLKFVFVLHFGCSVCLCLTLHDWRNHTSSIKEGGGGDTLAGGENHPLHLLTASVMEGGSVSLMPLLLGILSPFPKKKRKKRVVWLGGGRRLLVS